MRVLITRPRDEAETFAGQLGRLGVETEIEPLLEIRPRSKVALDLAGVQALLLTSANGARALSAATARRDLPVLAVGDATARAARAAGFTDVAVADGTVEALAELARAKLKPEAGRLLHVAGSAVAGDLGGALAKAGFHVERAVLYDAVTATELTPAARAALNSNRLDAVAFFSPRTAATFVSLVRRAGLEPTLARLDALCLSRAVAEAAAAAAWRRLKVAPSPELSALLDLVRAENEAR